MYSGWRWRKGVGFMRTNPGERQLTAEIVRARTMMEGDRFPPGFSQRRSRFSTTHRPNAWQKPTVGSSIELYKATLSRRIGSLCNKYSKYLKDWDCQGWRQEILRAKGTNRKNIYSIYKQAIADMMYSLKQQGFTFSVDAIRQFRTINPTGTRVKPPPLTHARYRAMNKKFVIY